MPAGEVIDYVKIISDERQKELEQIEIAKAQEAANNSSDDVNMAGNTLPGNVL